MPVKEGDIVKVDYEGTLEDGTVFDRSADHPTPLSIQVGSGMVIKGFEQALVGMEVGDEKEVKIPPGEGYGERDPELVKELPKEELPSDTDLKKGMILLVDLPDGGQLPLTIADITDETITIDLNPPLAGKTLIFKLKVVEIVEGGEINKVCGCSCDQKDECGDAGSGKGESGACGDEEKDGEKDKE